MLEWMQDTDIVRDLHRDFSKLTIDDCKRFIDDSLNNASDLHLAITDESSNAPDEYLGTVSLKHIDADSHSAEFGITIRRIAMGSGLAYEAMQHLLNMAQNELNLKCVYWCVSPDNNRALRFYDKNGYIRVDLKDRVQLYDHILDQGNYEPSDIDRYVWYVFDRIDVSVYMMTYFHEHYVRQAIESVLAQETTYRYELVISDDCSQDGTADILREYAEKYPDIIRININETNLGIPTNIYKARTMCRGRYITNLSGDDYWIRNDKIEAETRFMDDHSEYSAVACRIELRMDDSETAYDTIPRDISFLNRPFTVQDYEKCKPLGTHGLFMRNFFLTEEGRAYFAQAREISEYVDDAVDEVLLLRKGPIYVMDITSDAHRVVASDDEKKNYNSRYTRLEKFKHHIDLLNGMSSRWGDEIDFSEWYAKYFSYGFMTMILCRQFGAYKAIIKSIPRKYKRPFCSGVYLRSIPYMFGIVIDRIVRHRY